MPEASFPWLWWWVIYWSRCLGLVDGWIVYIYDLRSDFKLGKMFIWSVFLCLRVCSCLSLFLVGDRWCGVLTVHMHDVCNVLAWGPSARERQYNGIGFVLAGSVLEEAAFEPEIMNCFESLNHVESKWEATRPSSAGEGEASIFLISKSTQAGCNKVYGRALQTSFEVGRFITRCFLWHICNQQILWSLGPWVYKCCFCQVVTSLKCRWLHTPGLRFGPMSFSVLGEAVFQGIGLPKSHDITVMS